MHRYVLERTGSLTVPKRKFEPDFIRVLSVDTRYAQTQIRDKVRLVVAARDLFQVALSTAERIAVALVLNRHDLLEGAWGTVLECVHRLGPEWTAAALRVQRDGWGEDAAHE